MDQIKIGRFIAEERKRKGYTQKQLAELLKISDKTISKWETGKGFPEISLLLPLCTALDLNVNELLSGERLVEVDYKRKAEENMIKLVGETQKSGRGPAVQTLWSTGSRVFLAVGALLLLLSVIFFFINVVVSYPLVINGLVWSVLALGFKLKESYDRRKAAKLKQSGCAYEGRVVEFFPVHWVRIGSYIAARVQCAYLREGEEATALSGIYLLTAFNQREDFSPMIYCGGDGSDRPVVELYRR